MTLLGIALFLLGVSLSLSGVSLVMLGNTARSLDMAKDFYDRTTAKLEARQ